ncbi:hypothetical protein BDV25DRAFT_143659 [Aspergillus avenaceus]|uniref:Transcription factor domain-containing protein n=1 Tax=Aspergillus avenaceus TaxID=36643 RepID=A0A5N6TK52_ASPAV|nr:hypothetical protein BDV25DRAFT_143659 [Aspergillus avenaceus]
MYRPSRRRRPRATDEVLSHDSSGTGTLDEIASSSDCWEPTPFAKTDIAEYAKGLVSGYIYSTYAVVLKCPLDEPTATINSTQNAPTLDLSESICVDETTIRQLLSTAEFISRLSPLNISYLRALANDILIAIPPGQSYMPIQGLSSLNYPLDRLALVFAALAVCCVYPERERINNNTSAYFSGARYLLNSCTTGPTVDLCMAYYLQYLFALRTSSDIQDTTALALAIRTAQALKIHETESSNPQPAKLYLFLYFHDQCCAMAHNLPPLIKTSDYKPTVFDRVLNEEPDFRPLVDILIANGRVLEALYGKPCDQSNIRSLEELMGCVSKSARKPMQPFLGFDGFNINYEAPVQIHMFWARITLRLHNLPTTPDWISSMSICVRSAQMILLLYFQTYNPKPHLTPPTQLPQKLAAGLPLLKMEGRMPLTWRQVKRIITSAFILVYGYWHGEVTFEEVCRGTALALVLHECQRIRWGRDMDGVMGALRDIAGICGMSVLPHLSSMLPDVQLGVLKGIAGQGCL